MIPFPRLLITAATFALTLSLLPGQGAKVGGIKTQIKGTPARALARAVLVRGELCTMPMNPSGYGKVKLYRESLAGGPSAGAGVAMSVLPNPVADVTANKKGDGEIEFTLPLTVPAGRFGLQFEMGDTKSAMIPVIVADPKMKLIATQSSAPLGEGFVFSMNHCPSTAKVFFTRTYTVDPPQSWWAPVRSYSMASCAVSPTVTKKEDGSVFVKAIPPAAAGAGIFECRIKNGVSESVNAGQVAVIHPPVPLPNFQLRYDGIDCLVDTNEIGDDEVYAIFVRGFGTENYNKLDKAWYSGGWTRAAATDGPVHMGLNKGKSQSANKIIAGASGDSPFVNLALAVILLERDDDENGDKKYYTNDLNQQFQSLNGRASPENVRNFADGAYKNATNKSDFIDDDLIGIVKVSLDSALSAALKIQGWQPASVMVNGDGGKFRLRFSVRCDPWTKGPPSRGVFNRRPAFPSPAVDRSRLHNGGMSTGRLVVGVTGASGAIYAQRFLREAVRHYETVYLILSRQAIQVAQTELGVDPIKDGLCTQSWLGEDAARVTLLNDRDYFTPPASGSFVHDGMVVVPCSMGSAGRIANGISNDLLTRSADVCLKEGRKLILVPREMPWNLIMLRNLTQLAEAGATILPASPAWYHHPQSLEDLADTVVARILQSLGVEQTLVRPWMAEGDQQ